MSAVEVITVALAAGAGVGVKDTASAAVKDAYSGLKALLKQRLGGYVPIPENGMRSREGSEGRLG